MRVRVVAVVRRARFVEFHTCDEIFFCVHTWCPLLIHFSNTTLLILLLL